MVARGGAISLLWCVYTMGRWCMVKVHDKNWKGVAML